MAGEPASEATEQSTPALKQRSGRSGTAVTLKDRYNIYPASPIPEFDMPSAKAYTAEDKKSSDRLYALICQHDMPTRIDEMRSLRGVKVTGLLPLIEFGPVTWPDTGRTHMAILYSEPVGGRIRSALDTRSRIDIIHERDIATRLIAPLSLAIKELHDRRVIHRSIRPDNLYYFDAAKQLIVFGDCVTSPPGYDQPFVSETINACLAQPSARGTGTSENDLYSFGVVILSMLTGRIPCAELSDEELLHAKISQGSYQSLVGEQRLPLPLTEILRGLLSDDSNQRWNYESVELWQAGRRLSPIQVKSSQKAQRDFSFKGKNYSNTRELALGLSLSWDAAVEPIRDGQIETWLRRSLDDKTRAEAITLTLKTVDMSSMDPRTSTDFIVTRVGAILDPNAPIRYRGLAMAPDGIGSALAVTLMKGKSVQLIAEAIAREIPRLWLDAHESFNTDHSDLAAEFREMRSFLMMTAMGYGIERCLYELNKRLQCLSPLIINQFCLEAKEVLPAIELASKNADMKTFPVDRHIASFVACRYDRDLDPQLAALNDAAPERMAAGTLSFLAVLQFRFGPDVVLGVASWCGGLMAPMVNSYHDREKRRALEKDLTRLVRKGSLPELFAALDDPEERQKDRDLFTAAKAEYITAEAQIAELEKGGKVRDTKAELTGKQTAAITSVIIAFITVTILVIVKLLK